LIIPKETFIPNETLFDIHTSKEKRHKIKNTMLNLHYVSVYNPKTLKIIFNVTFKEQTSV